MRKAKEKGYADRQIAHMLDCYESEVYKKRKDMGINRVYKLVDTCAAEFEAKTPYYYSTFDAENESVSSPTKRKLLCWAQVRTESDRELNLITLVFMVCWQRKNVVTKPS